MAQLLTQIHSGLHPVVPFDLDKHLLPEGKARFAAFPVDMLFQEDYALATTMNQNQTFMQANIIKYGYAFC